MARTSSIQHVSARLDHELGKRFKAWAISHGKTDSEALRDLLALALSRPLGERELRTLVLGSRVVSEVSAHCAMLNKQVLDVLRRQG